jgi:hypothetical protein
VKEVQSEDKLRNVFGDDDFALHLKIMSSVAITVTRSGDFCCHTNLHTKRTLLQTGYKKPITSLTLLDRPNIMSVLFDYHTMGRSKVELDQFGRGLALFGFLEIVKSNPQLWKVYYCNDSILTPGKILWCYITHIPNN